MMDKMKFEVTLKTMTQVQRFVYLAGLSLYDVTVKSGRYIIDGKSLMGMFSLDLTKPIKVTVVSPGEELAEMFTDFLNKTNKENGCE